jgi:hypothetical protein
MPSLLPPPELSKMSIRADHLSNPNGEVMSIFFASNLDYVQSSPNWNHRCWEKAIREDLY